MAKGEGSKMGAQFIPGAFYSNIRNILILVFSGVQICDSFDLVALLLQLLGPTCYKQTKFALALFEYSLFGCLLHFRHLRNF